MAPRHHPPGLTFDFAHPGKVASSAPHSLGPSRSRSIQQSRPSAPPQRPPPIIPQFNTLADRSFSAPTSWTRDAGDNNGALDQSPLMLIANAYNGNGENAAWVSARVAAGAGSDLGWVRLTDQPHPLSSSRPPAGVIRRSGGRFKSRLDVERHLDPVSIGMCDEATAESLVALCVRVTDIMARSPVSSSDPHIPRPFASFFANLANYSGFLDPSVHTLYYLRSRSIFLLTVILYTASRHVTPRISASRHTPHSTISATLEQHLQAKIWPQILLGNFKSVHIVQACMVWATHLPPARPGEDDQGWSLFGQASEWDAWCDPPHGCPTAHRFLCSPHRLRGRAQLRATCH